MHGAHRTVLDVEPVDRLAQVQRHSDGTERVGDERAHVEVERARHGLLGLIDERDVEPPADEGLGHLEPDVATADDDAPARRPLVDGPPRGHAVRERLHAEDATGVGARDVRT